VLPRPRSQAKKKRGAGPGGCLGRVASTWVRKDEMGEGIMFPRIGPASGKSMKKRGGSGLTSEGNRKKGKGPLKPIYRTDHKVRREK